MTNREKLKKLMDEHSLTRRQVAKLCHVSIYAVHNWLLPEESAGHRDCPEMALDLLKCKLMD